MDIPNLATYLSEKFPTYRCKAYYLEIAEDIISQMADDCPCFDDCGESYIQNYNR